MAEHNPLTSPTRKQRPKRLRARRPPLTIAQILAWADDHHARTGRWPNRWSGRVLTNLNENWGAIWNALSQNLRGLESGLTLAQLLARERGVRNKGALPRLTEAQILAWAQEYHRRTHDWPTNDSGPIPEAAGEVWWNVATALRLGLRGLPGGDSLARLLRRHGAQRSRARLPPLTVEVILQWADAHFSRTGHWPNRRSGRVAEAAREDWDYVNLVLRKGLRSLPGGSSLARLLAQHRGVQNPAHPPPLTIRCILAWADAYWCQTGAWPTKCSGPIAGAEGERWRTIDTALRQGLRGLPGGSTLAQLLVERRGVSHRRHHRPALTIRMILDWADAHFARWGRWPSSGSGAVEDAPGESWGAIDKALQEGIRGLPGGDSLARFLERHGRGKHVRGRRRHPEGG